MKVFFKFSLYAAMIAAMACSFSACSNDDDVDDTSGQKDEMYEKIIQQFTDHTVTVTYKNLADNTEMLEEKLQALKVAKTDANVQAACEIFLEARAWWEKSEAFLFGAASDFGIDPHIDSWPLDLTALKKELGNASHIADMAAEDADVWAGDHLGNALLGFHGIEYIIFKDGKAKPVSEITNDELIYAAAVAGDLRNKCFQLQISWAGEDNVAQNRVEKVVDDLELSVTVANGDNSYQQNMLSAGKAGSTYKTWTHAVQAIVDGCKTIADEVGTSKIGKPHTGEDRNYIESPYSYMSITDTDRNHEDLEFLVLRKYTPEERIAIVREAIYRTENVGLVIIDGIRDMVYDINSSGESTRIISLLMTWTGERNIHIHTILHQNKGDENARGHIGTELSNKAETVLQVEKDSKNPDISTVKTAHIRAVDFEPFAFRINEEALPELLDGYQFKEKEPGKGRRKFDPYKDVTEQQHRIALEAAFTLKDEYGYKELERVLRETYASVGVMLGGNRVTDLITVLKNKRMIVQENGRKYTFKPDFHY